MENFIKKVETEKKISKRTFKIYINKKKYFFISKILNFITIPVKCIFWQIFKEIVANKDL